MAEAVKHANIVINVVGIDADTRHFAVEDVHETGAEIIAKAARDAGVERLIHVSALGANPNSESRFLASKVRTGHTHTHVSLQSIRCFPVRVSWPPR